MNLSTESKINHCIKNHFFWWNCSTKNIGKLLKIVFLAVTATMSTCQVAYVVILHIMRIHFRFFGNLNLLVILKFNKFYKHLNKFKDVLGSK